MHQVYEAAMGYVNAGSFSVFAQTRHFSRDEIGGITLVCHRRCAAASIAQPGAAVRILPLFCQRPAPPGVGDLHHSCQAPEVHNMHGARAEWFFNMGSLLRFVDL